MSQKRRRGGGGGGGGRGRRTPIQDRAISSHSLLRSTPASHWQGSLLRQLSNSRLGTSGTHRWQDNGTLATTLPLFPVPKVAKFATRIGVCRKKGGGPRHAKEVRKRKVSSFLGNILFTTHTHTLGADAVRRRVQRRPRRNPFTSSSGLSAPTFVVRAPPPAPSSPRPRQARCRPSRRCRPSSPPLG